MLTIVYQAGSSSHVPSLNSELPRPQDGADPVYDEKCRQIRSTLQDLEKELESLRQKYPKVSLELVRSMICINHHKSPKMVEVYQIYPIWKTCKKLLKMAIEMVSFPMKQNNNCGFP